MATKGSVALDEIRPIVVSTHISKIIEKAILAKIIKCCPHLIESKMYKAGFKEGKSTAIHVSRLLREIKRRKRRKREQEGRNKSLKSMSRGKLRPRELPRNKLLLH